MSKAAAVQKSQNWKELFAPSVVLVMICLVTTLALAITYQVTKPIIAEINRVIYEKTQMLVLPQETQGFDPYDGTLGEGIQAASLSRSDVGKVVTAVERGYGGPLTVMVGIDANGAITGIQILSHKETPGLGTKTMTEDHLGQYLGQSKITNTEEAGATQIDAIGGATISSDAIYRAVSNALSQYETMGGVKQ